MDTSTVLALILGAVALTYLLTDLGAYLRDPRGWRK